MTSGRGVGMGAIRQMVEEVGGVMRLISADEMMGKIPFKLEFSLPGIIESDRRARSELSAEWKLPVKGD
ncbi:MAG: hypothetical protein EOP04_09085 [Proteobacteria bacterium]|nr:MAG: hypothetical protein EOP04_09085 [Pseudomonadota bacterium]